MLERALVVTALFAVGVAPLPAAAATPEGEGGTETARSGFSRVIVQLQDRAAARAAAAELAREGATVHHEYSRVLTGFAATVPAGRLEALRRDPRVTSVVSDGVATPDDHVGTPWGLDRIDQREGPGDGAYHRDTDGRGATAYVIDSGIRTSHADFGGRARWGVDLVDGSRTDCTGHGTHVAGTIGGTSYGVAPAVDLVAVRVFGCSHDVAASWSTIIAGLDWVVSNRTGPSVANMSLSGLANPAMDDAVARATTAGVAVVVTAGNDGYDACQKSPARAPSALTVAATSRTDARASFSNHGPCVDLFAPGVDIPSASTWDGTGHWVSSGTSMAAAHVSGAVARHLQAHPAATAAEVASGLTSSVTRGVVTDARSVNDGLLHVAPVTAAESPVTEVAPEPVAVTAPSAPDSMSASATSKSISASWQAPASTGGAAITAYVVSVYTSTGDLHARQRLDGGTLSTSVSGVTRRTSYRVEVQAVNPVGTGAAATRTVTTK